MALAAKVLERMRKVLLIGLGNPGEKCKNNRHNAGKLFVRETKDKRYGIKDWIMEESGAFMNESGKFVRKAVGEFGGFGGFGGLENLYIVHDDLDIPLGQYKIQFGKGPQLHYGVQSVEKELGTKDFWRIRIGIDARSPAGRETGEKYVLQDFTAEERQVLNDKVFPKIWEELAQKLNYEL